MDVFRREQFDHFRQDAFYKPERRIVAGAVHVGFYAPGRRNDIPFTLAAEVRIGCERSGGVPRHFDFGDDRDEPFCGILYDVADFVLRVETAVGNRIFRCVGFGLQVAAVAERADFGQFGVLFDFDPPTLVVGQVPVETIEFVHSEDVDESFHVVGGKEVTTHVQHSAAVGEVRLVGDLRDGQFDDAGFFAPRYGYRQ